MYWDLVDHAYGKPVQSLEIRAGPIDPLELETWSDEKIEARLEELEAESEEESEESG